jgi:hypothetical protein
MPSWETDEYGIPIPAPVDGPGTVWECDDCGRAWIVTRGLHWTRLRWWHRDTGHRNAAPVPSSQFVPPRLNLDGPPR